MDATVLDPQTRQAARCSKLERKNLRQALTSWRDQYWADVRSQFPFFPREWINTDGNIVRLVDIAHLLFNQPNLDIGFVREMILTIADDAILSLLVTTLEAFCTAWREKEMHRKHLTDAENFLIDDLKTLGRL